MASKFTSFRLVIFLATYFLSASFAQGGEEHLVWVSKPDDSLAQYLRAGRPLEVDEQQLKNQGIPVSESKKALGNLPFALPIAEAASLNPARPVTTPALSGIVNAFLVPVSRAGDAAKLGFQYGNQKLLFARGCEGLDAIVAFGQSNSANSSNAPDLTVNDSVFMFQGGYCFPARDPILGASIHHNGGSLWMPFAKRYTEGANKKVVIVSFGVGGSQSSDWAGGQYLTRLIEALFLVKQAKLNVVRFFWHQGESDNLNHVTGAEYEKNLAVVLTQVREAGFQAPFSVAVATALGFNPLKISTEIQEAQVAFAEKYPGVELGVISDFYSSFARYDGLHLNETGLRQMADRWFKISSRQETDLDLIRSYYELYLQRPGSPPEWSYWLGEKKKGKSMPEIRVAIRDSDESFIRGVYAKHLRRLPEKDALSYWLKKLETSSDEAVKMEILSASEKNNANPAAHAKDFDFIEGMLQPKTSVWQFDVSSGTWVRR